MNKKLITAMLIAFVAVKNPVAGLAEPQAVYAAESQKTIEASAVSEANIAVNVEGLYNIQTPENTDQKANDELTAYQKQLDEQKQAEIDRIAAENARKITKLENAGLSAQFIQNYVNAQAKYNVPWEVIAAVHYVETHQSGDTSVTSYAGAQGPMQFMPSTFYSYGQDGDGDGQASIGNVNDAIYTGANYLASNGAANGDVTSGLYRYNHDYSYVNHVLTIARSIGYNK